MHALARAETLYLFGDIDASLWRDLLDVYVQPPYALPGLEGAPTFGIGAAATGVPFHFHGPGFGEMIFGRKVRSLFLCTYSRVAVLLTSGSRKNKYSYNKDESVILDFSIVVSNVFNGDSMYTFVKHHYTGKNGRRFSDGSCTRLMTDRNSTRTRVVYSGSLTPTRVSRGRKDRWNALLDRMR